MSARNAAVLVVDDAPAILLLLKLAFAPTGRPIYTAATGREALDLYRRDPAAIGTVLLDVHLPDLGGPAVLRQLRRMNPAVRCFFTTRATDAAFTDELWTHDPAGVFGKPFAFKDVAAAVVAGSAVAV